MPIFGLPTAARPSCRKTRPIRRWYFGDSPQLAHELAELVLHGPKRATAGLGWTTDALPHTAAVPDGYSVVTEFDGAPRAVIRTTGLERRKFREVDATFAWDEGEGDRTLEDWKRGHWQYFSRECESLGRTMSEDAEVCLERFELLYPFEHALNPIGCGPRIVPGSHTRRARNELRAADSLLRPISWFWCDIRSRTAWRCRRFLDRYNAAHDGIWLVVDGGRVHGSIVIDGGAQPTGSAQLRWFIVDEELQATGWGNA